MTFEYRFAAHFSLVFALVLVGCKTAPPQFTAAQFQYTVKPGDSLDSVVSAYQKQGVDVWPGAVQMANDSLYSNTNLSPGTTIIIPARNCILPRLIEPIEFDGYIVSQISNPQAAKYLMTQKLQSPGTYYSVKTGTNGSDIMVPHHGFDFLRYEDGRVIRTETVQQYIDACATNCSNSSETKGAYAATTCDIDAEMRMQRIQGKLEFMAKAQPSIHSFLDQKYLAELPVTVLMSSLNACDRETSDRYEKILKTEAKSGKTLKDYTKTWAPLHITNLVWEDETTLRFKDATMGIVYRIKELARGDVNEDGFEDALIEIGWQTEGTMGGSYTTVVTGTAEGRVKFVEAAKPDTEPEN